MEGQSLNSGDVGTITVTGNGTVKLKKDGTPRKPRKKSDKPRAPQITKKQLVVGLVKSGMDEVKTDRLFSKPNGWTRLKLRAFQEEFLEEHEKTGKGGDFLAELTALLSETKLADATVALVERVQTDIKKGKKGMSLEDLLAAIEVEVEFE